LLFSVNSEKALQGILRQGKFTKSGVENLRDSRNPVPSEKRISFGANVSSIWSQAQRFARDIVHRDAIDVRDVLASYMTVRESASRLYKLGVNVADCQSAFLDQVKQDGLINEIDSWEHLFASQSQGNNLPPNNEPNADQVNDKPEDNQPIDPNDVTPPSRSSKLVPSSSPSSSPSDLKGELGPDSVQERDLSITRSPFIPGAPGYTSEFHGLGGTQTVIDNLGVEDMARLFAELIVLRETRLPIAIGLFGNWGSGKSHFMNLIDRSINTNLSSYIE
jgi:hypothetical protein